MLKKEKENIKKGEIKIESKVINEDVIVTLAPIFLIRLKV